MAQELYQHSVPDSVKSGGVQSVIDFADGKDVSHILSVKNHPDLIGDPRNALLEPSHANQVRGRADMTPLEQSNIPQQTFVDSTATVTYQCLDAGVQSAFYAALLEAPVTAIENYILAQERVKRTRNRP